MERLNPSAFEFLIKLNGDYFLAEIDQRVVTGTAIPSAGFHTTYPAADKLCSHLRASGYPAAHVTDVYGVAITTDRLERESLDKPTPPCLCRSRSWTGFPPPNYEDAGRKNHIFPQELQTCTTNKHITEKG
jgi:hypothetical protein